MTKKIIKWWCDSGANIQSFLRDKHEVDADEWDAMTEDEQEEYMREIACARLDWAMKRRNRNNALNFIGRIYRKRVCRCK